MSRWRVLWDELFEEEEPDSAVAASLDEIERLCAPFSDDPFLVIAMFQHRHGQAVDLAIGDWLERHGETLRKHLTDANRAATRLYVAAGTASRAAGALEALGADTVERVSRALRTVEKTERALRDQAAENRSTLRTVREHMAWTRPTLPILLAASLLVSAMATGFLAKQAFASRPGDVLWAQLSDAEQRDLPAFVGTGALSDVMNCRIAGFRVQDGRCLPVARTADPDTDGWAVPDEIARRAAHPWSAEARHP